MFLIWLRKLSVDDNYNEYEKLQRKDVVLVLCLKRNIDENPPGKRETLRHT